MGYFYDLLTIGHQDRWPENTDLDMAIGHIGGNIYPHPPCIILGSFKWLRYRLSVYVLIYPGRSQQNIVTNITQGDWVTYASLRLRKKSFAGSKAN